MRFVIPKSNASGAFQFSYVTPTAHWSTIPIHANDTYIIAVDPPSASGLGRILVPNVVVTVGGTIPSDDVEELKGLGVAEVFTPGAPTQQAIDFIRNAVRAFSVSIWVFR